jgi:hypothetical protein
MRLNEISFYVLLLIFLFIVKTDIAHGRTLKDKDIFNYYYTQRLSNYYKEKELHKHRKEVIRNQEEILYQLRILKRKIHAK